MSKTTFARELVKLPLEKEIASSYTRYAMSVIVSRALPDVRDGLKPVQRRILYAMREQNMLPDRPREKCAAVVGEVMKKYHPHGDAPIYEALVRMAQDFNMRYPLIDGQGNFGSVDGDPPAQMRYTEARLKPIALAMLEDIDKDTVNWRPNYDDKHKEPVVLPAKIPNLLVNGATGIAVAMTTSIPPHNLGEVIDSLIYLMDSPEASEDKLMKFIPGPDFPTGGIIVGKEEISQAYKTGRGTIVLQGRATIENLPAGRTAILITELPYQVSKEQLIVQVANMAQNKKIEGIADINDETDRTGMRIVIEVKRDYDPKAVLNQLYKLTNLRVNYSIFLLALVNSEPRLMTLKELLTHFLDHRRDIIKRRTKFELQRAEARAHILEGLRLVAKNLEEVISIIRKSDSREEAKERLMQNLKLSDQQASAVLDTQLGQLNRLDQQKLRDEYETLIKKIEEFQSILRYPKQIDLILKQELQEVKRQFSDMRRTHIVDAMPTSDTLDTFSDAFVEKVPLREDFAIAISCDGYIKILPSEIYSDQKAGRFSINLPRREQDALKDLVITYTNQTLLFFSNKGICYQLKGNEVSTVTDKAQTINLRQILHLGHDEKIVATVSVSNFEDGYLFMATRRGMVKKSPLSEFKTRLRKGLKAIELSENDELCCTMKTEESTDVLLVTAKGMTIRFKEDEVRPMGRLAQGVYGIKLQSDDFVTTFDLVNSTDEFVFAVSEYGFGKKVQLKEIHPQGRGGKGIILMGVTKQTGKLVAVKHVRAEDEVVITTSKGSIFRLPVNKVAKMGRPAQGKPLIALKGNDTVTGITTLELTQFPSQR